MLEREREKIINNVNNNVSINVENTNCTPYIIKLIILMYIPSNVHGPTLSNKGELLLLIMISILSLLNGK